MPDSFWSVCTKTLLAHRHNNLIETARLLKIAEAALDQVALDDSLRAKRKNYVDRLKAHFSSTKQSESTPTVMQPGYGVDEKLFYPRPLDVALRNKLEVPRDHFVIVTVENGLTLSKKGAEVLCQAVESLNRQGCLVTMILAGRDSKQQITMTSKHVKDMGLVTRGDLSDIMAAADVLICAVEPGTVSKTDRIIRLLECFAMGRAVMLPRNVHGLEVIHKHDAYVLESFDAANVVNAVLEIKTEKGLADRLAKYAVDFYLAFVTKHSCKHAALGLSRANSETKQLTPSAQFLQPTDSIDKKQRRDDPMAVAAQVAEDIQKLNNKIRKLEKEKSGLNERLRSMPSIDPLCIRDSTFIWPMQKQEDFGIIVFGHTRLDTLNAVLESLKRQGALKHTEVWLDGFQGNQNLRLKIEQTIELVKKYPVKYLHKQSGNFGFRKMLILGLIEMCKKYRDILILEDDCFPTRDAVSEFRKDLDLIRGDKNIFSIYGHHFLTEGEKETCTRFQGWGWATTSEKLMPILRQLIDCYSMTEERYLKFISLTFTHEIKTRIDVTPPRQPSYTLEKFFAWDETLCLLTALNNQVHRPTKKRTIYNCGMGSDSTHFADTELFRNPPFNLITPKEVWQYF